MITHFYSDPHFGHSNIIQYAGRPFPDVRTMDSMFAANYLMHVDGNDLVCWCGDVTFHDPYYFRTCILDKLPGRKILVRGNHDGTIKRCLELGFELVVDSLHLEINGCKVTVCHYPPVGHKGPRDKYADRRPPKPGPGEYVIHGHTHEAAAMVGRRIHVGVDAWDFRPVPMSRIADLISPK